MSWTQLASWSQWKPWALRPINALESFCDGRLVRQCWTKFCTPFIPRWLPTTSSRSLFGFVARGTQRPVTRSAVGMPPMQPLLKSQTSLAAAAFGFFVQAGIQQMLRQHQLFNRCYENKQFNAIHVISKALVLSDQRCRTQAELHKALRAMRCRECRQAHLGCFRCSTIVERCAEVHRHGVCSRIEHATSFAHTKWFTAIRPHWHPFWSQQWWLALALAGRWAYKDCKVERRWRLSLESGSSKSRLAWRCKM